jgi:flagellar protein FlaG
MVDRARAPTPPQHASGSGSSKEPAPEVVSQQVSAQELASAVEDISSKIQSVQRNLSFSIDEESGTTVIKVIDATSDEVIRQMPSEEVLAIKQRLSRMSGDELSGMLVQAKA